MSNAPGNSVAAASGKAYALRGATGPMGGPDKTAQAALRSTQLIFIGLIVLLVVEYSGIAREVSILRVTRFSTVLSYALVIASLRMIGAAVFDHLQTKLLIALTIFSIASVMWAIVQRNAVDAIRPFVDYVGFYIVVFALVDRHKRADLLSWALAALSAYLLARNVAHLTSGVRAGAFTGAYFMGDGNDFAWAMVVITPLIINLAIGRRSLVERIAGLTGAACCVAIVVGTSSRGATLGLGAAVMYYILFLSRRKMAALGLLTLSLTAVVIFAPPQYFSRMETVGDYQEDNSARTRLRAWSAATQMAISYPLGVGAGNFSSAYGRYYRPSDEDTGGAWGSGRWIAAHSVYFKVLGEYGFLGLGLLLWLLYSNLRDNLNARSALLAARVTQTDSTMSAAWPGLVATSVVGYSVCGIFLGGIAYPHLFLITGLTVANKLAAKRASSVDVIESLRDASRSDPYGIATGRPTN